MVSCGRWIRVWIVGVVLSTVALCSAPAAAQESAESKRLLQDALTEFNAGRWDEAYALFKRLNEAAPNARTLRGMGLSAFEARRYATAVTDLGAALKEKRRPLNDEQRKEVQGAIEQANRFVARFTMRLQPDDAQVSVDGREPQREGSGVLLLDPGTHEVLVSATRYKTASRTLDVEAGDRRELAVELEPEGQAPVAESSGAPAATAPAPRSSERSAGGPPIAAYVAAGAAVVFAGGAVGLHFAAKGAASDVERSCGGACTPQQADAKIDDSNLQLYQTLSFVGWGLAGASAVTAAVLFVLGEGSGPEQPAVALAPAPNGIAVAGRF
jgi:hypothetical protein